MTMHSRRTARALVFIVAFGAFAVWPSAQDRPLQVPDRKSTRPAPRTASGRPDLSGYWKGTRETKPGGNIGKDLPGWKLPLTPAGEAALKQALDELVRGNQQLRQAILGLSEERLRDTVPGKGYSVYYMLHGAVQHDLYHAGQIALLKKA